MKKTSGIFFRVGVSKKKVISEDIIETVEETHVTSAPDPPNKIARISYDPSAKSGNQECILSKSLDTSRSKSVGIASKKGGLAGLVCLKSSSDHAINPTLAPAQNVSSANEVITPKPTPNGLSLLGSYSGSDSE
jgi:hypothetical protein